MAAASMKFVESFLADSDDDDEYLFKPSGLSFSRTKKIAEVSQDSPSVEGSPLGASSATKQNVKIPASKKKRVPTAQELEAKALRDAEFAVKFKASDYGVIHSTALLKWHCVKRVCYPCFVCPDVREALAGHDGVKITVKNNTLVRFLGCHHAHRDKLQAVPASQLKDFCGGENDDANSWSAANMKLFIESIRNQKEFKGDDRDLKLRTEELVLQLVLASVLEREQQQRAAASLIAAKAKAGDGDDDDDEVDSNDDDDDRCSAGSPPPSPRTWKSPAAAAAIAVPARTAVSVNPNQVKKLRAGDIIEYCPPHMVADRSRLVQGCVVACFPGDDPAVHVSTGDFLPLDHQVRIVKRFLRGKRENNPGATFVKLRDCKLDKSHNDAVKDVPTLAERVGKLYREAQAELAAFEQAPEVVVLADDFAEEEPIGDGEALLEGVDSSQVDEGNRKPAASAPKSAKAGLKKRGHETVTPQVVVSEEGPSRKKVKRTEPEWKSCLNELLAGCAEARKRRRADLEKIDANETALRLAIAARQWLDDMSRDSTARVEDLVDGLEEELECPSERLWIFLNGNPNNLLSVAMLKDVTAKLRSWLDRKAE